MVSTTKKGNDTIFLHPPASRIIIALEPNGNYGSSGQNKSVAVISSYCDCSHDDLVLSLIKSLSSLEDSEKLANINNHYNNIKDRDSFTVHIGMKFSVFSSSLSSLVIIGTATIIDITPATVACFVPGRTVIVSTQKQLLKRNDPDDELPTLSDYSYINLLNKKFIQSLKMLSVQINTSKISSNNKSDGNLCCPSQEASSFVSDFDRITIAHCPFIQCSPFILSHFPSLTSLLSLVFVSRDLLQMLQSLLPSEGVSALLNGTRGALPILFMNVKCDLALMPHTVESSSSSSRLRAFGSEDDERQAEDGVDDVFFVYVADPMMYASLANANRRRGAEGDLCKGTTMTKISFMKNKDVFLLQNERQTMEKMRAGPLQDNENKDEENKNCSFPLMYQYTTVSLFHMSRNNIDLSGSSPASAEETVKALEFLFSPLPSIYKTGETSDSSFLSSPSSSQEIHQVNTSSVLAAVMVAPLLPYSYRVQFCDEETTWCRLRETLQRYTVAQTTASQKGSAVVDTVSSSFSSSVTHPQLWLSEGDIICAYDEKELLIAIAEGEDFNSNDANRIHKTLLAGKLTNLTEDTVARTCKVLCGHKPCYIDGNNDHSGPIGKCDVLLQKYNRVSYFQVVNAMTIEGLKTIESEKTHCINNNNNDDKNKNQQRLLEDLGTSFNSGYYIHGATILEYADVSDVEGGVFAPMPLGCVSSDFSILSHVNNMSNIEKRMLKSVMSRSLMQSRFENLIYPYVLLRCTQQIILLLHSVLRYQNTFELNAQLTFLGDGNSVNSSEYHNSGGALGSFMFFSSELGGKHPCMSAAGPQAVMPPLSVAIVSGDEVNGPAECTITACLLLGLPFTVFDCRRGNVEANENGNAVGEEGDVNGLRYIVRQLIAAGIEAALTSQMTDDQSDGAEAKSMITTVPATAASGNESSVKKVTSGRTATIVQIRRPSVLILRHAELLSSNSALMHTITTIFNTGKGYLITLLVVEDGEWGGEQGANKPSRNAAGNESSGGKLSPVELLSTELASALATDERCSDTGIIRCRVPNTDERHAILAYLLARATRGEVEAVSRSYPQGPSTFPSSWGTVRLSKTLTSSLLADWVTGMTVTDIIAFVRNCVTRCIENCQSYALRQQKRALELFAIFSTQKQQQQQLQDKKNMDGPQQHSQLLFSHMPPFVPVLSDDLCYDLFITYQKTHNLIISSTKLTPVHWSDVGGLEEAKKEILQTVQLPIKYPHLFQPGPPPLCAPPLLQKKRGILLFGAPGCGKTLLAKAVATEMNMNFLSVKGPELINQYVGESERNIRDVFSRARDNAPCVTFWDELDALAPARGNKGDAGGAMDRIVSQLLVEMDNISINSYNNQNENDGKNGNGENKDVFVIAATNRPDMLDPALLMPGRFDQRCYLGPPDTVKEKEFTLKALTRKFHLTPDVSITALAEKLQENVERSCGQVRYTGADLFALCSDAMLMAVEEFINNNVTAEKEATAMATNVAAEASEKRSGENDNNKKMTSKKGGWNGEDNDDDDDEIRVQWRHFETSLKKLKPSVTPEEFAKYERLQADMNE